MGWADCGVDSRGRRIGYAFTAKCDHPGCKRKIDRGLGYACGGDHGGGEWFCEGYFCDRHLTSLSLDERYVQVCKDCYAEAGRYYRQNPDDCPEEWVEEFGEAHPAALTQQAPGSGESVSSPHVPGTDSP